MASAASVLIRIAKTLGPLVVPAIIKAWKDPRIRDAVLEQVKKLGASRGASPEEIRGTIAALRDQVDYLTASADEEGERRRAEDWRTQLEKLEHAADLLSAPGAGAAEVEKLRRRVDALRTEILEAFVTEQEEDADTGDRRGLLRRRD